MVELGVLSQPEWPFVDAARSIGASPWHIMLAHILPNTMAPLIIQVACGEFCKWLRSWLRASPEGAVTRLLAG